ncbi:alkaline phosphatase 4 isoform X1 [Vespa velutina]|uniref:alkaline phosphatase 4 isoform X1 n=2 Tax=Vespa velutina TaxID=202808 RepID=UPI001FB566F8|nr:alkaline phosphatase 4 isoform X1 [Vespa velutina]
MKRLVVLICIILSLQDSTALRMGSMDYEDMSFWMKSGQENLQRILAHRDIENRAKNVIVFIGDGMGISTITAGRILTGQSKGLSGEEYKLVFEDFPSTGFSKTYNVDKQVPDSAGTATAMFSGVKCRYRVIGYDAKARYNHCDKAINQLSKLTTIADWAQESGMDTGFVTTTRVTHATPAGLYAHVNNRDWECDSEIPKEYRECTKDIARQLVEDAPGNGFKVIMGGGAQHMGMTMEKIDKGTCTRNDGRNLAETWIKNNPDGKMVTDVDELMSVDIGSTSKIMGIFAPSHLPYRAEKNKNVPSLANMTMQAIRLLRKNKNGFLLMVEGGKIDIAHHQNYAELALRELSELEEAVNVALKQVKLDETLIIVTADHSHSFTVNGYPDRGNDILGLASNMANPDNQRYETLTYANGPGFFYHRRNDSNNVNETWINIEESRDRDDIFYMHMAAQYLKDDTHGGEDVGVYAIGPYSHLFRSTFEQNYIAHVIAYAACFKDWPSHCDSAYSRYFYELSNTRGRSTAASSFAPTYTIFTILILMSTLMRP